MAVFTGIPDQEIGMLELLKVDVCRANLKLVSGGLVVLTWGNVSAYDHDSGLVVIKPSGVSYEAMTPDTMAVVDLDGNQVDGDLLPSSDLPTHIGLYLAWPHLGAIVHTHSAYATMFAQAEVPIPCLGTTHADHFYGDIPVTRPLTSREVEGDYEANTAEVIIERFEELDSLQIPGVLVANHGPFTWGVTAAKAVENAVALEAVAKIGFGTFQLQPEVSQIAQHIMDRHFFRKHGPDAYYGQNAAEV